MSIIPIIVMAIITVDDFEKIDMTVNKITGRKLKKTIK